MEQEYVASKEMKAFFDNLLSLKAFVKQKADEMDDEILREIYDRFDKIIKEGT